ncbi:MMPL family transporter [Anaeromyxobacter sp. Fw109-5]|uniref:MMPL family transporter n=1 Tax=Anaeromyxobacter sp. (strain Fw109-5) TaxID=404589 RepID=UPI0000ED6E38|nr:MMPL family transporter [Anaeromyxobacter sp. Fw109-5]ABS28464.1 exporters of the RND superfamily [Anaeromyxobacter sp. Fw109-5]
MRPSERWVRFADRHRTAILAACAAVAVAGSVGTVRLYTDLRPDLAELLPESSKSAVDLEHVTARVGGFAEQTVILSGADPLTMQLFADDLAEKLDEAPEELVRWVEYRVGEIVDFYRPRLLLFPEKAELEELRDALAARIAWERANEAGAANGAAPDVEGLIARLGGERKELIGRFRDGYTMGDVPVPGKPGEKMTILAMIVRLGSTPGDYGKVAALDRVVRETVKALDPKKYAPTLEVAYGGYVTSTVMEHDALAEDLVWATILVILSVAASVAIYNRTWKSVPLVGIPLLAGTFATFGIAELVVGHLNSNTAFLGSIVVGNGINVGLILFARYLEERRRGAGPIPAMQTAVGATWLATLTAALAAGVAYASLLSTDFRGFNQFGLIGGLGMALSWLFSYVMTPPLVLAWERRSPIPREGQRPSRPLFTLALSHVVERFPRLTTVVALAVSVASVGAVAHFADDALEYDFRNLRDVSALAPGGPGWWDARVDDLFGEHLTPTALLARDEAQARELARRIEAHRRATPGSTIGSVVSVEAFVPAGQEEKLPIVREIRALATRENLSFLPPDRRMAVEAVLPPEDLRPFAAADLPEELRRQLTETDGRVGTPVLVYPSGRIDVWNGRDVLRFTEELRGLDLPADAPIASSLMVFSDVLYAIQADGPRATLLSLAGVVVLVLVAFGAGKRSVRSLADAGWVLAALGLGVLWFAGLAGAFELRLNMLNFIALPITFGIGVDYATNVFQRRRLDHARSISDTLRTTGGAVALCSVTTVIGYASLLVARNQALFSFGLLAVIGELACLATALLALPSVLRWREQRRREGPGANGGPAEREEGDVELRAVR